MYLYLCASPGRSGAERLFREAFFDYSGRAGCGLSRREAERAPLAEGPYGKPYFADIPNAYFSVSHSGRFWACLMAESEVGLDIEDLAERRARDERRGGDAEARYVSIAQRYFSEDEKRFLDEAVGRGRDELTARFFFVWTRKEAYVKYTGRGLGAGFEGFSALDGSLGVFFGASNAQPGAELSYCRADEAPIKEIIIY
jgi:4'-phosphopantetheinyl transferase